MAKRQPRLSAALAMDYGTDDEHVAVAPDINGRWHVWQRIYGNWVETPCKGDAASAIESASRLAHKTDVTVFGRAIEQERLQDEVERAAPQRDHCAVTVPVAPKSSTWAVLRYGPLGSITLVTTLPARELGRVLAQPTLWSRSTEPGHLCDLQMVRSGWSAADLLGDDVDLTGLDARTIAPIDQGLLAAELARLACLNPLPEAFA